MKETWLFIPGYEGLYEVSDLGRVRSGKAVKQTNKVDATGYLRVNLWRSGIGNVHRVHRLVLLAFKGPCPEGLEVRHLDGDKLNNRLTNLCYGTRQENINDNARLGRLTVGDVNGRAKLTKVQVLEIHEMASSKEFSHRNIAAKFNISPTRVSNILNKSTWRNLW